MISSSPSPTLHSASPHHAAVHGHFARSSRHSASNSPTSPSAVSVLRTNAVQQQQQSPRRNTATTATSASSSSTSSLKTKRSSAGYASRDASTQWSPRNWAVANTPSPSQGKRKEPPTVAEQPATAAGTTTATKSNLLKYEPDSPAAASPKSTGKKKQEHQQKQKQNQQQHSIVVATPSGLSSSSSAANSDASPAIAAEEEGKGEQEQEQEEGSSQSAAKRLRQGSMPRRSVPQDYSRCNVRDLVELIAAMLMELIRINDEIPLQDGRLTRFHSRAPPGISVHDYLQRLTTHATLSPPILLSMVFYIDRLCALYNEFTISSLTVHRYLIASATVASKGLSDSFWTNNTYARVGGVSLRELALLELEFLWRLEWRIVPDPDVLVDYYHRLVERHDGFELEIELSDQH